MDECRSKEPFAAVARYFVKHKLKMSYPDLLAMKRAGSRKASDTAHCGQSTTGSMGAAKGARRHDRTIGTKKSPRAPTQIVDSSKQPRGHLHISPSEPA